MSSKDQDFGVNFKDRWNKRVKGLRIACFIVGPILAILGVITMFYPVQSASVMSYVAIFAILLLGIIEIIDYFASDRMFRSGAILVSGILNIIIALILLYSPISVTLYTVSLLFAFTLLMVGIDKFTLVDRLKMVGETGTGWVIFSGVIDIIAAILFHVI